MNTTNASNMPVGQPYDPAKSTIQFWRKCVNEGMAAEFAPNELASCGLSDPAEQRIYAQRMLENALADYALTQPKRVYLRDNEQLLEILPAKRELHCAWGTHRLSGEICRKPVVKILWRWEPEHAKAMNSTGSFTGWRHADGSPLHRNDDEKWEPYNGCQPLGVCDECGKEWVHDHCSQCHENDVLRLHQAAYQDIVTCSTPGCTYEHRVSIGD